MSGPDDLKKLQRLAVDIAKVERNHSVPGLDRHENVAEHSFSVAMLSWRLFEMARPPLDLLAILKYALAHDAPERGLRMDVNTYAGEAERKKKAEREAEELAKLAEEFGDFEDLTKTLLAYEKKDEEALFVWSVDKIQHLILGGMDGWRPYKAYGILYPQFSAKIESQFAQCSPHLKEIFREVIEESRRTYYDRPE